MINPFKKNQIVFVTTKSTIIVTISFWGRIECEVCKPKKLVGRKVNAIIIDEIVEVKQ